MTEQQVKDFVRESNHIEGIFREGTPEEITEFKRFIELPTVTVEELQKFVSVYQPNARLRDEYWLNVRVGNYIPPFGGPEIREKLKAILEKESGAWEEHCLYENLHPFTDGNGRSGRALWAWKMMKEFNMPINLSFLHTFYYQTLQSHNK